MDSEHLKRCAFPGVRYLFVFMCFMGLGIMFAVRVNMNVAIVAMVNQSALSHGQNDECPQLRKNPLNISDPLYIAPRDGAFMWSPKTQGLILGSFYYLYCVMQIPGGRLAEMYSGKYVFVCGLGLSVILSFLTPAAARHSTATLIALRITQGAAQGVCFPAIFNLMGRWLPVPEKSLLQNTAVSGINAGSFISMLLTGLLCNSNILGGWPSAFYFSGAFGILFCMLWCLLMADTPREHRCITEEELKYIVSNRTRAENVQVPPIPWKRVLSSFPVWAVLIAQVGSDWCYYTLLNELAVFFSTILHFDIEQNGLLSSFPYLLQAATAISSGYISDVIIQKNIVSVTVARKFFNTLAGVGSAVGLFGVMLSGCNIVAQIFFFTFAMTATGFSYSGFLLVILDLSPEYAGTLIGLTNTVSTLSGFLTTVVVGYLTNEEQTMRQWRVVFMISISMLLVSSVIFLIGSSSEKQSWHLHTEEQPPKIAETQD